MFRFSFNKEKQLNNINTIIMKNFKTISFAILFIAFLGITTSCCKHEFTKPQISCQIHNRSFGAKEYNNVCIGTITSSVKLDTEDVITDNDWIDARIENPTINNEGYFVYPVYADIEAYTGGIEESTDNKGNTITKYTSRNIHIDFIGNVSAECDCGDKNESNTSTGHFRNNQWWAIDSELSSDNFIGTWELTDGYYADGIDYSSQHYTSRYMTLDITDGSSGVATNVVNDTEFPGSGNFSFTVNGDKITIKSGYSTTTYNVIAIEYSFIVLEYNQGNSLHTLEFHRQGWH